MSTVAVTWPPTVIGMGDETHGYWLGGPSNNKLIVDPSLLVSGATQRTWGSYGQSRGTTSTTNGLANTNTLYAFGNSITTGHPAAYYCKTLTTGGYNTWYLPAKDELTTVYSNKSAKPFADTNGGYTVGFRFFWSSTESTGTYAWGRYFYTSSEQAWPKNSGGRFIIPVRRTAI